MTSPRSFLAVMTGRLRRSRALHPNALQSGCGGAQGRASDSEPVVQVWGARARGFKGIFGVHSWIAAKPGGATEYTVYEVIGWRLRRTDTAVVVRTRPPHLWLGARALSIRKTRARREALIQHIDRLAREYPTEHLHALAGAEFQHLRRVDRPRGAGPGSGPTGHRDRQGLHREHRLHRAERQGFQFSLRGLLGVAASRVDGVEFNFLSLNFGVSSSGLKLPIIGRIGMPRHPHCNRRRRAGDDPRGVAGPRFIARVARPRRAAWLGPGPGPGALVLPALRPVVSVAACSRRSAVA